MGAVEVYIEARRSRGLSKVHPEVRDEKWQQYFTVFRHKKRKMTIWWQAVGVGWSTKERVALQESWQNEWHDISRNNGKSPSVPREDFENAVAEAKFVFNQGEQSQWIAGEDRRRRRVAFEEAAKRMLRYLEDSEDLKVGVTEFQAQLGIPEEAGVCTRQLAQQAINENGHKIFEIFRQGDEEVCIASLARWTAQLKGLAELEKRCRKIWCRK